MSYPSTNSGQQEGTAFSDQPRGVVSSVVDKAREAVSTVTEKIEDATSTVTQKASDVTSAVVDKIEAGGTYIREQGVSGIAEDLGDVIRRNPLPSLAIGFTIGFLIAQVIRPRAR